jgi:hypothetical protein
MVNTKQDWTVEEDAKLREAIKIYGENWQSGMQRSTFLSAKNLTVVFVSGPSCRSPFEPMHQPVEQVGST